MGSGRIESFREVVSLIRDDDEKVVNLRDFERERSGGMGFHGFRRVGFELHN